MLAGKSVSFTAGLGEPWLLRDELAAMIWIFMAPRLLTIKADFSIPQQVLHGAHIYFKKLWTTKYQPVPNVDAQFFLIHTNGALLNLMILKRTILDLGTYSLFWRSSSPSRFSSFHTTVSSSLLDRAETPALLYSYGFIALLSPSL